MRIHVAGVDGMLGSTLFRHLAADSALQVLGTVRSKQPESSIRIMGPSSNASIVGDMPATDEGSFLRLLTDFKPDIIINCIGVCQLPRNASEAVKLITANSLWPHRLAKLAGDLGARLIHFSSDGVFSGRRGQYRESDNPDPIDYYGRSKLLGEPDYPHCLTLRTSMIGHANKESNQLVDWLIRQNGKIKGYRHVVFTGLPTVEIASIVRTILLSREDMTGIWHLASEPISKFDLLRLIVMRYGLDIEVVPTPEPVSNRSLNASKFHDATDYVAPSWPELVDKMYEFQKRI